MEKQITASFESLQRDGAYVADSYLKDAVKAVDAQFGDGFARKNPTAVAPIIAAYMASASASYVTASKLKVLENVAEELSGALGGVAAAITEVAIELRQNVIP
ncbi:hypothetical protein GAY33_19075 [Azospirillum brasilense]|uniref:hypothetical protein n=1 Tax=Azospirillum argentinense TaxID=2970906 RepID=UPI00190EA74F|nr:hypothetical protein [Azospirillum argentinense]MBK3801299.1 hypothetical protein [Azospirillum argentinense]